jgi:uncharacterized protein
MSDVRHAPTESTTSQKTRTSFHGSYIWYELITPDPDDAKRFYGAVVGWSVETGKDGYGHLKAGDTFVGGMLGLTNEMRSGGARPTWLGYIAVDDVDSTVASIEQGGGKGLMPAFDIPDVGRIAMVTDPQGAPFYVMKPIPPAGDPQKVSDAFSPSEEQRVGWNELSTTDVTGALDFYGSQFGWEKGDVMPMGESGDYQFINRQGQTIGAIFPNAAGAFKDELPRWRYYFRVPSVAKAVEAAEAGGGTVKIGPMEVPGGDHIVIGNDPQGAEFALVGKA